MTELTKEEQNILENLVNPDNPVTDKYRWDEELQKEIIGLITNDVVFVGQSVGLIKPNYFINEAHQLISRIVFNHYESYKCLPNKVQINQELSDKIQDKDQKIKMFYYGELNTILDHYVPGIESREYYTQKITHFAKGQAMKLAFSKSLEELKKAPTHEDTWTKIQVIIKEAMSVERNFDDGLDYFADYHERYERMQKKKETKDYFITGFKEIDNSLAGGGLGRGEIGSVVGLPGTGKSIFLVNAAIANIKRDKRVLYLSLEIDVDKCAERFDAQFANPEPFGEANNGISIKNLIERKEEVFEALREMVSEKDDKKLLVVKQFPSGDMDVAKFRAYISQLEMNGFTPDLVIIDYIGEMRDYPNMPIHESRVKMVRDLRGFAIEKQIGIFTAMQPNGSAREQIKLGGVIDDDSLAEARGQNRPLDALWSINQLNEEKECGLARLFVVKHRDGKSRFTSYIEFNYDTLKMRQISKSRYEEVLNKYKNGKTTTIAEAVALETQVDSIVRNSTNKKFNDVGYLNTEDGIE